MWSLRIRAMVVVSGVVLALMGAVVAHPGGVDRAVAQEVGGEVSDSASEPAADPAPAADPDSAADVVIDSGALDVEVADVLGDLVAGDDVDLPAQGEGESVDVPVELSADGVDVVGDAEDPFVFTDEVTISGDDVTLENVLIEGSGGQEAALVIEGDNVTLENVVIDAQADAAVVVSGDGVVIEGSVVKAGSEATISVASGAVGVRVVDSKVGLPLGRSGAVLEVAPGASGVVELDGVEFCLDCYEATSASLRQSTCSTCLFLPGCSGGDIVQSFISGRGERQPVADTSWMRAKSSVTVRARGVYWGPGGPRIAGNPGGRGIRIASVPGVRVDVRPWLVGVIGPAGAKVSAPGRATYSVGKRSAVAVPQGSKVTVSQGGRSMVLRPKVDTTVRVVR